MSASGTIHQAVCRQQLIEQFIFPHENNCYLLLIINIFFISDSWLAFYTADVLIIIQEKICKFSLPWPGLVRLWDLCSIDVQ